MIVYDTQASLSAARGTQAGLRAMSDAQPILCATNVAQTSLCDMDDLHLPCNMHGFIVGQPRNTFQEGKVRLIFLMREKACQETDTGKSLFFGKCGLA